MLTMFYKLMELVNNFDTTNDKITYLLLLKKSSIYTINKFDSMSDNEFILEIKSELKSIPNIIEIELSRLETLKNENLNKAIPKPSKLFSNNSGLDQNSSSIDKNSISMFTVATLAEYLGVSKSYIYKITHKNLISYSKPSGKKIYFHKEDVDNFLKLNRKKSEIEIGEIANKYLLTKR